MIVANILTVIKMLGVAVAFIATLLAVVGAGMIYEARVPKRVRLVIGATVLFACTFTVAAAVVL